MALIKGLNGIYPRKWFRLLQPGKWALKPNPPQPTPHVERVGLVMYNAANGEQTVWLDKEPTALVKPGVWLAAARWPVVHEWCVWCVQVGNSSEQLLLIPRSVVAKTALMLVRECSSDFFIDLFPVSLGGSCFSLVQNQTSSFSFPICSSLLSALGCSSPRKRAGQA